VIEHFTDAPPMTPEEVAKRDQAAIRAWAVAMAAMPGQPVPARGE
jgi:hypothetical protein